MRKTILLFILFCNLFYSQDSPINLSLGGMISPSKSYGGLWELNHITNKENSADFEFNIQYLHYVIPRDTRGFRVNVINLFIGPKFDFISKNNYKLWTNTLIGLSVNNIPLPNQDLSPSKIAINIAKLGGNIGLYFQKHNTIYGIGYQSPVGFLTLKVGKIVN